MKTSFNSATTMVRIKIIVVYSFIVLGLWSCDFDRNKPGYSYYPDMEESRAYETYSSNPVFSDGKTNQLPVENTIARGNIPYHFVKTDADLALAGKELMNPYENNDSAVSDGKRLYTVYCINCHGEKGDGKGNLYVSGKYPYPPASLLSERAKNRPEGELFHIISVGYGVMGAHQSIINPDERWKIVSYIKSLQ